MVAAGGRRVQGQIHFLYGQFDVGSTGALKQEVSLSYSISHDTTLYLRKVRFDALVKPQLCAGIGTYIHTFLIQYIYI